MRIGVLTFRGAALDGLPPARLRAMLAEALMQGATLEVLDVAASAPPRLAAHCWTGAGWDLRAVPPPDVAFVIGASVQPGQAELAQHLADVCPIIRDVGLKKHRQTALFSDSSARRYVIPSQTLQADGLDAQVTQFLTTHGGAVIKRSDSNQGLGLLFAVPGDGLWTLVRDASAVTCTLAEATDRIVRHVRGRMAYRDFVIQKFIPTSSADGRPTDIRVHVQRGATGAWGITRAYVRLGEPGRLTANVSKGAFQGALRPFLAHRQRRDAQEIEAELFAAALELADIQSTAAARPLSELGLDFLLDETDGLWLIETNALPQSSLHELARAEHSIAYAIWYAAQAAKPPEIHCPAAP